MSANKKTAKTLELVKWANFCCGQIDDYLFLGWRRGSLPRQGRTQDFNWGAMKYLCLSHMIGGEGGLFDRGLKWGVVPPLPLYQPSPASPRQLTASKWCVASPLSPIMEPWHSTYHECLYSDQGRADGWFLAPHLLFEPQVLGALTFSARKKKLYCLREIP